MTNLARLERKLKRRGYTQERLAELAAVDRTYINHFFNGRRSPKWLRVLLEELARDEDKAGAEVAQTTAAP